MLRALRRACTAGPHGLPLIGIGDWNDGMNRVGVEGRGESVWLAWFLIKNITKLFSKSYLVKNDAAVSVARGFRKKDWQHLFRQAGIENYNISWQWAFRFLVSCKK